MGERAQSGYAEAEREAFRKLPPVVRLKANLTATLVVGWLFGLMLFYVLWPIFISISGPYS